MEKFAVAYSRALVGLKTPLIEIEAQLSNGLPQFHIVGLPETEVKESRDRVRAAILQSGFSFPNQKITINLAPAELPKESGRYDLPIALALLAAAHQIRGDLLHYEFAGELALSGSLRAVRGGLLFLKAAEEAGRIFIGPKCNESAAALFPKSDALFAENLQQVIAHLNGAETLQLSKIQVIDSPLIKKNQLDLNEVKGQQSAKRALEIAAAGRHNLLLEGPPGTGKSMLAARLPSILTPLNRQEMIENAIIHSISDHFPIQPQWSYNRPFRCPHHTASAVAVIGGGAHPRPGEITLAHNGVLFLDELPEFPRKVMEVLREPLENREIHISRTAAQVTYPADFQLIAAMNPCPCGFYGHPQQHCTCTLEQIKRYRSKVSGPFLDRIDLIIQVPAIPVEKILQDPKTIESSATVAKRVEQAQARQYQRQGKLNALLSAKEVEEIASIDNEARLFLLSHMNNLQLSTRSYHKILRIARTLADLKGQEKVDKSHVIQAITFRRGLHL